MKMKYVLVVVALVLVSAAFAANVRDHKVFVNHKGKVIQVSGKAISAHRAHGDALMVFVPELNQFLTEAQYVVYLADLENDYEEVGAETAEGEGEEDVEEEY